LGTAKELADLLKKAIEARQKPIEVHSENVIDPNELVAEDF
jgi:hypothetical protein